MSGRDKGEDQGIHYHYHYYYGSAPGPAAGPEAAGGPGPDPAQAGAYGAGGPSYGAAPGAGFGPGAGQGFGPDNANWHRHPGADSLVKGLLIGAGAAYLLTNETAQRAVMRSAVQLWTVLRSGVEELKERLHDAEAEVAAAAQAAPAAEDPPPAPDDPARES